MPTRKDFKTVGDGILSSFISRNNDVNSAWGIGKLYSQMQFTKSFTIEIDLIDKSMNPPGEEFAALVNKYSELLFKLMKNRNLTEAHLKRAVLTLKGFPNQPKYPGLDLPDHIHRIQCVIKIIDDRDLEWIRIKDVWCRPFNPETDLKHR